MPAITTADLRRHAVCRSLIPPGTLTDAIHRLRFLQADPIRAPARAQDLTLRHRVKDYRAGDQERRKLGYYALPLLWRDRVIGWANLSVKDGGLVARIGYVGGRPPRERAFPRELDAELDRMRRFLG